MYLNPSSIVVKWEMEIHSVLHYSPAGTILCDSNPTDLPVRDCVSGSSCLPQENSLCLIPSLSHGSGNLGMPALPHTVEIC